MQNDNIVTIQVEISSGSNVKYEINHQTNKIVCDRFLFGPFVYPFNYGYIINTLGGDNDPLDAVIICKPSLHPSSFIKCKIIGALITSDENGRDEKILVVPISSIDPTTDNINEYTDLDLHLLEKIKYFFEHYKDLEKNKFVIVENFISSIDAVKIYKNSIIHENL